jgi:hypothetical protein
VLFGEIVRTQKGITYLRYCYLGDRLPIGCISQQLLLLKAQLL